MKKETLNNIRRSYCFISLGYSSENWGDLPELLNRAGYLVIAMDFRGHGKSIYDGSLKRKPWVYFTTKAFARFPADVEAVLAQSQKDCKEVFFKNYAIVGRRYRCEYGCFSCTRYES